MRKLISLNKTAQNGKKVQWNKRENLIMEEKIIERNDYLDKIITRKL